MLSLILVFLLFCHHPDSSSSGLAVGTKIHLPFDSPLTITVYRVAQGSVSGIQKAFDDHNHDTIAKGEEFTVLVDFSSPFYNKERQWYEIPTRFCYGKEIETCVNQKRPFSHPYLVRPSSVQIPVPFVIPFSKIHQASLPDGTTVNESGTVHEQFKTFLVNGAKYDTSAGILERFLPEKPEEAGKISGIEFSRDKGRVLKHQPLVQCYFVEWSTDGCAPGLNHLIVGYDAKSLELKRRPWLNVKFSEHRMENYIQTIRIGKRAFTYLVPKDMIFTKEPTMAIPFSHVFASVKEQVTKTSKSVVLKPRLKNFLGSGKYKTYSEHYRKQASSAAVSGIEIRSFRAEMSEYYLRNEANWDDDFKRRWKSMLEGRKKEDAMLFFSEYGTHYVVDAVMGGRQEAVFTVNYCKVTKDKETKTDFETQLKNSYEIIGGSVQAYYNNLKSGSLSNMIISGPRTTCTGGNSLDLEVCYNLTHWEASVLSDPYPIRMTGKPFYTLVKGDEDRLWMKKMYHEYLKADLDKIEINNDIEKKVKCKENRLSGALPVAVIAGIVILELWS